MERYTSIADNAAAVDAAAQSVASLAMSSKNTVTANSKQQSHAPSPASQVQGPNIIGKSARVETGSPAVSAQSQVFSSPVTASPLTVSGSEEHISGHEPRYFPGVVSRRRRDSTRQSSMHESDDAALRKVSSKRDASKEGRGN